MLLFPACGGVVESRSTTETLVRTPSPDLLETDGDHSAESLAGEYPGIEWRSNRPIGAGGSRTRRRDGLRDHGTRVRK